MSEKLKRLQSLAGAKTTRSVHLEGLPELVAELQRMALEQAEVQRALVTSVEAIVAAIQDKELKSTDVSQLTRAVKDLKLEVTSSPAVVEPVDYRIDFERDQRGLMKPGVILSAVPRTVN